MPCQPRREVRPLVFGDASDYSPVGRVGIALQRYMALGKDVSPIESMRASNMLVHPEDMTRILNMGRGGPRGGGIGSLQGQEAELLPDMKPSSFAVTPEADIDAFLSAVGSPSSDSEGSTTDEEDIAESPFGSTPSFVPSEAASLRAATAAADQALYTNYHVVIVLDVSQSAFAVARNGDVLIDRMPSIVDLIIGIIRETVMERTAKYQAARKRASAGRMGDASSVLAQSLLHRVWCPKITVSLLLGNAPFRKGAVAEKTLRARPRRPCEVLRGGGTGPPLSSVQYRMHAPWGHATGLSGEVPFLPHNTSTPFEPWAWHMHGNGGVASGDETAHIYSDIIPVFIARPAEEVIADTSLNQRVFSFLRQQEVFIREMAAGLAPRGGSAASAKRSSRKQNGGSARTCFDDDAVHHPPSCDIPPTIEWESSNIASLIEAIVSMLPSESTSSHTVAIVSNFANTGASEDVALLRPAIMSRGVTLGLFSLTAVVEWNWSHLAPVGCLLSTTGGFSVPYGRVEVHRMDESNTHWLRRIDSTDCLARSMFLRRLTDYPGVLAFAEGSAAKSFLPLTTPNGEMQTAVVFSSTSQCFSTLPITGLAAARVAEGWSAQLELDSISQQPKRCRARHNCFLHRGELTFYFESEATTLVAPDAEGRSVVIESSLIAYASSHVIADMAFILRASEEMRLAIENKGGRRLTISALLRQFLAFMNADRECIVVSDAAHVSLRSSRPPAWDDRFIASVATHSRPHGCSLPWLYRHAIRQVPIVVHVPALRDSLMSGSLVTHDDWHARTGSSDDSTADFFDTAAAWRRSRATKAGFVSSTGRRQGACSHLPPAVTAGRLQSFVDGALAAQGPCGLLLIKSSPACRVASGATPLSLSYVVVSKDLLTAGLGSSVPSIGLVQFFFVPGTDACGHDIGALEGQSGAPSSPNTMRAGHSRHSLRERRYPSVTFGECDTRASYFLANCIEVRFTFSFVSIRNQAPMIRKVTQLFDEYSARIASGDPCQDFRYFGFGGALEAMRLLASPFQHAHHSLLLTDSEGTSSASNSHVRHGQKRFYSHDMPSVAVDESGLAISFDRISSLASGYLSWSTLLPSQQSCHVYRNLLSFLIRRRLAQGFEVVQYTACGTWAALYSTASMCLDILQVHENASPGKGVDVIVSVVRQWHSFDSVMRPPRGWQPAIDFERDHFIMSTFYSFTMVLAHSGARGTAGAGRSAGVTVSPTAGDKNYDFFSRPLSIASKDFVRNGGHTAPMYCLSGLLHGLHADAALSVAPVDCVSIDVSCSTSFRVGAEIINRMHTIVRALATTKGLSHILQAPDLPPSILRAMTPLGMCSGATVTVLPCSEAAFLAVIVPIVSPGAIASSAVTAGDSLRVFVAQISIDSVLRGMSHFSKTEIPRTFYALHYAIAAKMPPAVPKASAPLITLCATLEVFCVASRAWLLQRAVINMPPSVPIPSALRAQFFAAFKGLSLYSKDVNASFIGEAWRAHPISTSECLASTMATFLQQQHSLRPLQGPEGDDEMAQTTFLVTNPSLISALLSSNNNNTHPNQQRLTGDSSVGITDPYNDVSDSHISSASGGHRTDGEGGRASASAVIDAAFVPLVLRFLLYSRDADGHGTSAWVGSRQAGHAVANESSANPVSLFLRIFIVSLPHDVFNITSHGFRPPPDIIRRFVQGISEDLASADEPIPPSWNYFNPQPLSCDDLLLPFDAMPPQRPAEGQCSAPSPVLTDPMLRRFVRLFPCRAVGVSNQLPSPSCTDIVNSIGMQFLSQTADAALVLLHKALRKPSPAEGDNDAGSALSEPSAARGEIEAAVSTASPCSTRPSTPTCDGTNSVSDRDDCSSHRSESVGGEWADNAGSNCQSEYITIARAAPYFATVVSKALLAPEGHFRVHSSVIEGDMLVPDVSAEGRGTARLMDEVIRRDGLPLISLGNMTYGTMEPLDAEGKVALWLVATINSFDSTLSIYRHVTRLTEGPPDAHSCAAAEAAVERIHGMILSALRHIYLSQYLFKLRATRWADDEDSVIPRWWGVQYADAVPQRPNLPPPPWDANGPKARPVVKGEEVLSIGVHPQFQPKRLLNQMHLSRHFDMLKIVDRRGCFIVPDDVADYIWHYIRILLIPDGVASDPDEYPPVLPERPPAGSRFRLVVHIYKSTSKFSIDSTLQALRECYESIAVKELLQYIGSAGRREALSADDMALLAKERVPGGRRVVPLHIDACHSGSALAKLQSSLTSHKFLPTRRWDALPTSAASHEVGDPVKGVFIYHNPAEPTDIIVVSAEVAVDVAAGLVSFELSSSWHPRYEEETQRIARCIAICLAAVECAQKEMTFVSTVGRPERHPLGSAPAVCDSLLGLAKELEGKSADLRHLFLRTTPRLSAALFSQYVESFCGVLSELSPSLIVVDGDAPPTWWPDFSWERHEETQHRIETDSLQFYIVSGVRMCQHTSTIASPLGTSVPITRGRGLPHAASSASLASSPSPAPTAFPEATGGPEPIAPVRVVAVRDVSKRYVSSNALLPAVIVRISTEGTSVACHSITDVDLLFDAFNDVNSAYSKRLGMMGGLLTQLLGIQLSPFDATVSSREFNQGRLATRCCGDVSNVHSAEPVDVTAGYARRFMAMGRLPTSAVPPAMSSALPTSPAVLSVALNGDAQHQQQPQPHGSPVAGTASKAGVFGMLRRHLDHSLPSVASLSSLALTARESHCALQQSAPHLTGADEGSPVSAAASPLLAASPPAQALMSLYTSIIYSGLTNRGVMVDYCLPMDAAVKVLHDDAGGAVDIYFSSPLYAALSAGEGVGVTDGDGCEEGSGPLPQPPAGRYERCEVIVRALLRTRQLVESRAAHNAGLFKDIGLKNHHAFAAPAEERLRVVEIARPTAAMPVDPFVPQHYHRHLSIGHIVSERQFMSRRMQTSMGRLQPFWTRKLDPSSALPIVKSLIRIMAIAKYYYGSRVPEYSLRREATAVTPEIAARYCDPTRRVVGTAEGETYAPPVRKNLLSIAEHLNNQFASLYMVSVNPEELPEGTTDSLLLERCSNRCGLVVTGPRDAAVFTTNVIYCAVPIRTAVKELLGKSPTGCLLDSGEAEGADGPDEGGDTDLRGGLFVMEVGFNYVNYAIDMYIAGADEGGIPPDLVAEAACAVRSRIQFSSAVYDFMVRRLFDLVSNRTAVLPGHQNLTESLANITKYNPTAPRYSYNQLSATDVTGLLLGAHHRRSSSVDDGMSLGEVPSGPTEDVIRFVVPDEGAQLSYPLSLGDDADAPYNYALCFRYAGLLTWEGGAAGAPRRAVLYTLLVHPDGDAIVTGGVDGQAAGATYAQAAAEARARLMAQIQSNDQQALVDRLWREVKRGLALSRPAAAITIPRKAFGTLFGMSGLAGRCPQLPPPPRAILAPCSERRLSDLIAPDGDGFISWDDLATLERFVTRISDPSSAHLMGELSAATADAGASSALAWAARVPSAEARGLAATAPRTDLCDVALSLAEAICVYLRSSAPSQRFLEANGVSVHIADRECGWCTASSAGHPLVEASGVCGSGVVGDAPYELSTSPARVRLVFAPSPSTCPSSPIAANFLVVLEIVRPSAAIEGAPHAGHRLAGISVWREGYGAYGEASARLSDEERSFLGVVHSYITAVMWAGFL